MTGTIFNVQRFCVHDGPGIRTSIFFKGCPLTCLWCHNPEGRSARPLIMFSQDKCAMCGKCASVCPKGAHTFDGGIHALDRSVCAGCGKCAEACVRGALELCGKEYTIPDIVRIARNDIDFYAPDGGVTFTGGEPMAQFEFLLECAEAVSREQIGICLETSGFAPADHYRRIAPFIDLFLLDIKQTDSTLHKRHTGVDLSLILGNLRLLEELNAQVILRCPVIPGINDNKGHFEAIGDLSEKFGCVRGVELEPYHPLGIEKAKKAGVSLQYTNPEFLKAESLTEFLTAVKSKTSKPVKIS